MATVDASPLLTKQGPGPATVGLLTVAISLAISLSVLLIESASRVGAAQTSLNGVQDQSLWIGEKKRQHKQAPTRRGSVQTFKGSCAFDGTVQFSPPLTVANQETTVSADAPGHCSGTLVGSRGGSRQLDQAPSLYWARSSGVQSCGADPSSAGAGYLRLANARIDFTLTETRVGPAGRLSLSGRNGGSISAVLAASGDPVATAMACAGSGLAQSGLTISGSSVGGISG